jgi:hypothetical protein
MLKRTDDYGFTNRLFERRQALKALEQDTQDQEATEKQYRQHLTEIQNLFNKSAKAKGLSIRMDVRNTPSISGDIASKFANSDNGKLHHPQILTLIDVLYQTRETPDDDGVLEGNTQCGKSTTCYSLQIMALHTYLLQGRKIVPIFVTTNQKSHRNQMNVENDLFVKYYGNISFYLIDKPESKITLNRYYNGGNIIPKGVDNWMRWDGTRFIFPRTKGKNIEKFRQLYKTNQEYGISTIFILDESEYGVYGGTKENGSVLHQMTEDLEDINGKLPYISVSAFTPSVRRHIKPWKSLMYIGKGYHGWNIVKCPTVPGSGYVENVPKVYTFEEFGCRLWEDDTDISPKGYKNGHSDTEVEQEVYKLIKKCVAESAPRNPGICFRFLTDNGLTAQLIDSLEQQLNRNGIRILRFFGPIEGEEKDVKNWLELHPERAKYPNQPYVIFVTNRARLGDAFPKDVEWFIDATRLYSSQHSLYQGLIGRATGYGKDSKIILTQDNKDFLTRFINTDGNVPGKALSIPSIAGVGKRVGAPTGLILVGDCGVSYPEKTKLFEYAQKLVDKHINGANGGNGITDLRKLKNFSRFGAFWREDFFAYTEANQLEIRPEFNEQLKFVRRTLQTKTGTKAYDFENGYSPNKKIQNIRFEVRDRTGKNGEKYENFLNDVQESLHDDRQTSRPMQDRTDRTQLNASSTLLVQVNLAYVDNNKSAVYPHGRPIPLDQRKNRKGRWIVYLFVYRNETAVQLVETKDPGTKSYSRKTGFHGGKNRMTPEERDERDELEAIKAAAAIRRRRP